MPTTTNNGWTTPADSDPFKDGALAIRTLGNGIDTTSGNTWKAWVSYTPTTSGLTIGNGTLSFKYCQIGKTVHVRGQFTLGTTSAVTTTVDFGLPVASTGYTIGHTLGNFSAYNNSTVWSGTMINVSNANSLRVTVQNAAGSYTVLNDISATVPFTWANTHKMFVSFTYEAA